MIIWKYATLPIAHLANHMCETASIFVRDDKAPPPGHIVVLSLTWYFRPGVHSTTAGHHPIRPVAYPSLVTAAVTLYRPDLGQIRA